MSSNDILKSLREAVVDGDEEAAEQSVNTALQNGLDFTTILQEGIVKGAEEVGGDDTQQLVDLASDPGEMTNLAEDPKHQAVLDDHRRRLRRWVDQTGDAIAQPYVPK